MWRKVMIEKPVSCNRNLSRIRRFLNKPFKLRCDTRFQHAFTACSCIFKKITLVGSNQSYFFESATACSKRMPKTRIATQL